MLDGVQGEPIGYTASWSGLQPFTTYVGLITYGESGAYTVLQVVTGDGPLPGEPINLVAPSISGKAEVGKKLTADPGEWDVDAPQVHLPVAGGRGRHPGCDRTASTR